MKISIEKTELANAVLVGSHSLLSKVSLPILANILLEASENKLEIITTNLETAVKVKAKCKVESAGKTTVPGRPFLEYISQLPETTITVEKLGEELVVTAKGYKARFSTMPAEEFPAIPKITDGKKLLFKGENFVKAVQRVAFSAAQDESRPVLTGVLVEALKKGLRLVATDGYRLSFDELALDIDEKIAGLKLVIPAKTLIEVSKIINEAPLGLENNMEVVIAGNQSQANFIIGDIEFTSRLIEGEFPGWQKIIPTSFVSSAIISKVELVSVVRMAAIFARESGSIVKLKLDPDKNEDGTLEVSAATSQVGSENAKISVKLKGKGGEIAFNFRYLLEILSIIEGEDVVFEMNESLNPGKLTVTGEKSKFFHIIMPVRLQG